MKYYDVFNGDADGLCALHQLRLHTPKKSTLITGVKRDVTLLSQIEEIQDSSVTVLDISLEANHNSLQKLLNQNNEVHYWDHHRSGILPNSPLLHACIDLSPQVCTSILVQQSLKTDSLWAIVAAFGDNLISVAETKAKALNLSEMHRNLLQELGVLMNYNAYGKEVSDLHIAPTELYHSLYSFEDPRVFCGQSTVVEQLREGYHADMQCASDYAPCYKANSGSIFEFPDVAWSRRVSGVFGNQKANEEPSLAHAVFIQNEDGTFIVGVRAPLERPGKAGELCQKFGGGGRASAGGVNELPETQKDAFFAAFQETFKKC